MILLFARTGIVDCLFLKVIILSRAAVWHLEDVKKTSRISLRANYADVSRVSVDITCYAELLIVPYMVHVPALSQSLVDSACVYTHLCIVPRLAPCGAYIQCSIWIDQ
jgi:hypothetical protein